nr:hypothetical protein [Tanacetum cinerariifolium]
MLIFSHAPLFLWAKVIATACFTQNRSIIHRRFNKTPYELINGRKLDISFLHVFGALCYPKNDREDIRKLGAKGDIGFFIGYSADSCAYRIYNRRTKKIMETMNVSFDELLIMAFKQRSSKPGLQCMTSGQISSGLDLTYAPSTITTHQPTEGELDSSFEAMYDDYISGQPSSTARAVLAAQAHQVRQTSTTSTSIADTAPTPTNSSSLATKFPITSQDVDELNSQQQHVQQQGNQAHLQFENVTDDVPNACFVRNLEGVNLLKGLPKFKYHKEHLCPSCEQGKSKRASHPPKPVPNSRQRLHLLHMDLCGPMRIASINGKRYILVIVDDYSRYTWVHFLRSKDEAPEVIIKFLKRITVLLQSSVIIIRTDNGTEFKNQVLKVYFDSVSISHQMSSVRTPQQNGVVERRNWTLVEAARTMLIFSRAPLFLWAEAIATACFTQNRSIIHRRFNKTFIGYSADSCAYRVYNRQTKKIIETMNVSFDELSAMAFEQRSSNPGFKAMYDDYFGGQPSPTMENVPPVQEPQVRQTSTASTSSADNVPIPINSSSHATNIPITSQDVDELNPNAMFDGNTFVNPFATSSSNAASSSYQNVDPSNMHTFYQPYPHEFQWTK